MDFKKICVDKTILILSMIVIIFQIYGMVYLTPKIQIIMQTTDGAERRELIKASALNIPFLAIFVVGVLSTLAFPAVFFIKNRAITAKKWLLVIIALAVYFLNLYLVLAIIVLGLYLWKNMQRA